jgi:hypothetical protein
MKKITVILIASLLVFSLQKTFSQGCVAIRSTGAVCTRNEAAKSNAKGWHFNTAYRYFKSYKHFVGKEEQKERVERGTDVRNWQHNMNFTLVRQLNNRWAIAFDIPVISNTRSSMYEHYGNSSTSPNARRTTSSFGIGDVRVTGYYWLLDPVKSPKGNIQAGLGIKLPTGDYKYTDLFYRNDTTSVLGPVDQSIQLGDGGTGFTTEINAYYNFTRNFGLYGNFYYLINPREQNGTSTARGGTVSATAIKYGTSTMSVPDQYMIRAGGNFSVNKFTASAGVRMECVPSEDLIGGSSGFRRPGYVLSVEPGLSYAFKNITAFATVPVAVERNRTQSYSDKLRSVDDGIKRQGDAAFADYAVNIGFSLRF